MISTSIGANTYFVLEPGYQLILEGNEEGKPIQLTITVLNETRLVDGTNSKNYKKRQLKMGGWPKYLTIILPFAVIVMTYSTSERILTFMKMARLSAITGHGKQGLITLEQA